MKGKVKCKFLTRFIHFHFISCIYIYLNNDLITVCCKTTAEFPGRRFLGIFMSEQKLEPELNLSLNLSVSERMMCSVLCSGYNYETDRWRLILLYQGSLEEISGIVPFVYVPLLGPFAIIDIASADIGKLLSYPQILYLELSRPLYLEVVTGLSSSCLDASPFIPYEPDSGFFPADTSLTGRGTAIAVIDSGVDYRHADFRNADGSTRILSYWDQSSPYENDNRYRLGHIFSEDDLNELLLNPEGTGRSFYEAGPAADASAVMAPTADVSGHGTHVAGICAGNGRSSGGRNRGVAPEASLIVVKLKNEGSSVYTDYASLMMALDYVVRFAREYSLPLSVNISYGSNDGAHNGSSLIERFLQNCIYYGRNTITVGTGNEGLSRRHSSAVIPGIRPGNTPSGAGLMYPFSFSVASGERNLYLQLWKNPVDSYDYQLTTPDQQTVIITGKAGIYRYRLGTSQVLVSISQSTPYQPLQEVFVSFGPLQAPGRPDGTAEESFLPAGIWQFTVIGRSVTDGRLNLWLPSREATNSGTGFLDPDPALTLTIPSSAKNVISVSGYDSSTDVFASFSGQGFTGPFCTKPDLCAPAVNILSTTPGGGYSIRSGTSMAAPFVSGSCALLMQWGIVRGNDPFLFGEKVKAALWKGSRALPAFRDYPNAQVGWGKLCFRDSVPE